MSQHRTLAAVGARNVCLVIGVVLLVLFAAREHAGRVLEDLDSAAAGDMTQVSFSADTIAAWQAEQLGNDQGWRKNVGLCLDVAKVRSALATPALLHQDCHRGVQAVTCNVHCKRHVHP